MNFFRRFVLSALLSLALATATGRAQGQVDSLNPQESRTATVIEGVGQPVDAFDSTLPAPMRAQHLTPGTEWAKPFLPDVPSPPISSTERIWRDFWALAESLRLWLIAERNYWWVLSMVVLAGWLIKKLRR